MSHTDNWNQIRELINGIQFPAEGNELFLFGAGLIGALAASVLRDKLNITAICDNSPRKQGTTIEGLPCIPPDELAQHRAPFVLVSTNKYYQDVHQQLEQMKIPHCSLDAYVVKTNFEQFECVYSSLDDSSKDVFSGVLLCRMTGDIRGFEQYYTPNQYFCLPKFSWLQNRDGVFVDCGAFVGDTVENIIKYSMATFREICAFEPTERAFQALRKRGAFLTDIWALTKGQIVYEQKGVGAKRGVLAFRENTADLPTTSLSNECSTAGDTVEVITLDEYFAQREARNVAFIKADIEGSEWDMLHGAAETIRRCKPLLAICLYHNIYDLYRIPLYLKELVPEYQFHIRHHSSRDEETVLYCEL